MYTPAEVKKLVAFHSRYAEPEPTIAVPVSLLRDLADALDWYTSMHHDVTANAPEYIERHGDLNALFYLADEVAGMRERVRSLLAPPDPPADKGLTAAERAHGIDGL